MLVIAESASYTVGCWILMSADVGWGGEAGIYRGPLFLDHRVSVPRWHQQLPARRLSHPLRYSLCHPQPDPFGKPHLHALGRTRHRPLRKRSSASVCSIRRLPSQRSPPYSPASVVQLPRVVGLTAMGDQWALITLKRRSDSRPARRCRACRPCSWPTLGSRGPAMGVGALLVRGGATRALRPTGQRQSRAGRLVDGLMHRSLRNGLQALSLWPTGQ